LIEGMKMNGFLYSITKDAPEDPAKKALYYASVAGGLGAMLAIKAGAFFAVSGVLGYGVGTLGGQPAIKEPSVGLAKVGAAAFVLGWPVLLLSYHGGAKAIGRV
jgi:hypothetical protein